MAAKKLNLIDLDRLHANLLNTGLQVKDQPLYQVIDQLIQANKQLQDALKAATASTTNNITNIIRETIVIETGDGGEGDIGPPGIRGIDGAAGATGATGPPFPAFIQIDSDYPEEIMQIPGPIGPTGATGATGADGSRAIGFVLYEDGPEGEMGPPGPSGNNTSGAWTLIEGRVCTGNAQEDFINLSGYSDLIILCKGITKSGAGGTLNYRVSIDNGATFLAGAGDYVTTSSGGVESNFAAAALPLHLTVATAARTAMAQISGFNVVSAPKNAWSYTTLLPGVSVNTSAYNAIRVLPGSAVNLTGGTIYLFGRP